jgi:hypothetical protein
MHLKVQFVEIKVQGEQDIGVSKVTECGIEHDSCSMLCMICCHYPNECRHTFVSFAYNAFLCCYMEEYNTTQLWTCIDPRKCNA